LKVDLLRRASDAVTRIVTHGWFTRLAGTTWGTEDDRKEFTWGYGEWLSQTRGLQAELQAYYQANEGIWQQWEAYCELLRVFHELTWKENIGEGEQREKRAYWLAKLTKIYETTPQLWKIEAPRRAWLRRVPTTYEAARVEDVQWTAFKDPADSQTYIVGEWPRLKRALEAPLEPLAAAILGTPMTPLTSWR
jgi:hypothetical protein